MGSLQHLRRWWDVVGHGGTPACPVQPGDIPVHGATRSTTRKGKRGSEALGCAAASQVPGSHAGVRVGGGSGKGVGSPVTQPCSLPSCGRGTGYINSRAIIIWGAASPSSWAWPQPAAAATAVTGLQGAQRGHAEDVPQGWGAPNVPCPLMSRDGSDSSPDLEGKSTRPLGQPERKQEVTSGWPQRGRCGGHHGGQGAPMPQKTQPVASCHRLRPPQLLPDFLAGCSPHRTEGAQSFGCFKGQSGSLRHLVVPGQVAPGLLQLVGNSELGRRNWEMVQRHLAAAKSSAGGWL